MAYWLHTAFTFGARRSLRSLLLFSAGVATGFPLSVLVTAFLYSGLGAPMIVAAPVTTIVLICWNYCSASWSIGAEARRRLALKALGRN
jgi:putative flippase GtrA